MLNKIKKTITIILAILVGLNLALTVYVMIQVSSMSNSIKALEEANQQNEHKTTIDYKPVAETHKSEYDFGQITKADGKVSTVFEIENHGKEPLELSNITTSCSCTSAEIDKTELNFNEVAKLTVTFDPNYHAEPEGRFERVIYVETNDPDQPEMQFKIYIEILD